MRGTRKLAHPHRKTTTLSFTNWPAPWPSGELRVTALGAEGQSDTNRVPSTIGSGDKGGGSGAQGFPHLGSPKEWDTLCWGQGKNKDGKIDGGHGYGGAGTFNELWHGKFPPSWRSGGRWRIGGQRQTLVDQVDTRAASSSALALPRASGVVPPQCAIVHEIERSCRYLAPSITPQTRWIIYMHLGLMESAANRREVDLLSTGCRRDKWVENPSERVIECADFTTVIGKWVGRPLGQFRLGPKMCQ